MSAIVHILIAATLITQQKHPNRVLRHTVILFIQGRIPVQNLFTIYMVKEINACSITNLFVLNKNFTLDE